MPPRLPSLLAAPPAAEGRLWLTGARLFAGTGASARDGAAVLVEDGRIARVGAAADAVPEGARVIDLAGRTLMPGLVDAHVHVKHEPPATAAGAERFLPSAAKHFVAAGLREMLRMGFTTVRDVGSYGDDVVEARQAMRYGAFRGPRLLTCGRIVSPTAPGGRFFPGMYREADGPDDVRRAVREQLRRGADFVKVMSTGARSVELEDPDPAQLTAAELATLVEEAHRMGYRVAAHAEGLAGTELAIEHGVDTIEHGMYLHQRPDLLERMARSGPVPRPDALLLLRRRRHGRPGRAGRSGRDLVAAARRVGRVQPRAGRPHAQGGARGGRADRAGVRLDAARRQRDRDRADGPARPHDAARRSSPPPRPRPTRSGSARTSGPSSRASSPTSWSSTATRWRTASCCCAGSGSGSCSSSAEPVAGAALERAPF